MSRARITTPTGAARSSDTRNRISNAYACLRWDIMSEVPLGPTLTRPQSSPPWPTTPATNNSGTPPHRPADTAYANNHSPTDRQPSAYFGITPRRRPATNGTYAPTATTRTPYQTTLRP